MTSLIFLALSGLCNAIMDTITYHYDRSIFYELSGYKWWNPKISWNNKYNKDGTRKKWLWGLIKKPVQVTDAWHLFKMLMLIFIVVSIVTYKGMELWYFLPLSYITWNGTFVLFYRYILKVNSMKNMIKWLERNMIGITVMFYFGGTLVALLNLVAYYEVLEYIYLSLYGVAVIGTVLQIIWAWIVNPIRRYYKNKKL